MLRAPARPRKPARALRLCVPPSVVCCGMASPPAPGPPQRRRLVRRLILVSIAVAATLALAVLSLRIPSVGTAVANFALARIAVVPDAVLGVRAARGGWLTHLVL